MCYELRFKSTKGRKKIQISHLCPKNTVHKAYFDRKSQRQTQIKSVNHRKGKYHGDLLGIQSEDTQTN